MSMPNDMSEIKEKINEIEDKSADGDYIYRGEPECHEEPPHCGRVSSNLYRQYAKEIEAEHFDVEVVQDRMLEEARDYIHEEDELEVLTQLQHYGGKTNLIDFTVDYLIALFFACDGFPNNDGRVVLLQKTEEIKSQIEEPRSPINRVRDQKSIFVRPPKGFIKPGQYKLIKIPKYLKQPILNHLRKYHGISTKTIYNDLHGFIRVQSLHQSDYTEFFKGLTYHNREKYDEAIEHYTEALKLNPQHVGTYYNRGNAYLYKTEFILAIQDYTKAIELKPDYTAVYINRGVAYDNNKDHDRAIRDFNKAIELKSDCSEAYSNRGAAYRNKGYVNRAVEDYNEAIRLQPSFAEAHRNRGIAYCSGGDFGRALEDFNRAIQLKPHLAENYSSRGALYISRGDYERAIEDFNKAIEWDPNFAEAYCNRAVAYYKQNHYECAINDYDTVVQLNPDYADAYYNRGEARLHLSEFDKAREDLKTAKNKGADIIAAFHNDYESVQDFEEKNDMKLPQDIVAMLEGSGE